VRIHADTISYTDISSGFFPAAKERFKDFSHIEFATLDITKDPIAQGFLEEGFDLIIAANVGSSPRPADFMLTRPGPSCHPKFERHTSSCAELAGPKWASVSSRVNSE
jgi:hypothetical protein